MSTLVDPTTAIRITGNLITHSGSEWSQSFISGISDYSRRGRVNQSSRTRSVES